MLKAALPAAILFVFSGNDLRAQSDLCAQTELHVKQLVEKKAEYHRLTNGETSGYRIKIHFGIDRENANAVRTKFNMEFPDLVTYEDYQQPNWVVLVGDYPTKLKAFESLKKIQSAFPNAFIVKGKIKGN